MAFFVVSLFSPADPVEPYQTGTTDPSGRFAFVPDSNGVWVVIVDDAMGHAVNARLMIDAGRLVPGTGDVRLGRGTALLVGLSLVFGLFGVYAMARNATGRIGPGSGCGEEECACTSPKE